MSWVMTDAVLLARHSRCMRVPPVSCKSNHRIILPLFEGAGNKISPNLQPWKSCLHYTQGFPPKRRCNNKDDCMFGITRKNVDKKWPWTQRCYTYNNHSAWMKGPVPKMGLTSQFLQKNVDCTVSEPSWQKTIKYIFSRIHVSSLQCLCTCADWY